MRIIFDGKILNNRFLDNVQPVPSETEGKTDAVSFLGGDETVVLGTFDTEQAAKDYINELGNKLVAQSSDDVIDAR